MIYYTRCGEHANHYTTNAFPEYQLLAHGRWFSPGTPASSTTKTDRHDIAEILLKVALNTKNQNHQLHLYLMYTLFCNLQSGAQTHAILVIGLYELLGNSTT
jgi:hypothetical protein